jgi:hypothetical protein
MSSPYPLTKVKSQDSELKMKKKKYDLWTMKKQTHQKPMTALSHPAKKKIIISIISLRAPL